MGSQSNYSSVTQLDRSVISMQRQKKNTQKYFQMLFKYVLISAHALMHSDMHFCALFAFSDMIAFYKYDTSKVPG